MRESSRSGEADDGDTDVLVDLEDLLLMWWEFEVNLVDTCKNNDNIAFFAASNGINHENFSISDVVLGQHKEGEDILELRVFLAIEAFWEVYDSY